MPLLHGDTAPWNAPGLRLLPEAAVPTMLSDEECRLLHWLAARPEMAGTDAVDLGCFAGGSTARIASGLAAAGHAGRVHAHDFFTVGEPQKQKYLYPGGVAPFEGDDLLPVARAFLAPFRDRVALHRGDVGAARWDGGRIGLLFVDAAKTPSSADRIAAGFFRALEGGVSMLVQQDYQHWRQPWVAAQMELLAPCFELAGWCAEGSVLFRCTRTPDRRDLARARVEAQGDIAMTALLRRAVGRFPTRPQKTALARMVMALEDNPGLRSPRGFDRSRFAPERVAAILRSCVPAGADSG